MLKPQAWYRAGDIITRKRQPTHQARDADLTQPGGERNGKAEEDCPKKPIPLANSPCCAPAVFRRNDGRGRNQERLSRRRAAFSSSIAMISR
jgi:hypothetical protein